MVAPTGVALGLAIAAVGVLDLRHAHGVARFEERLDAIGSATDASTVEPAAWKVQLTKLLGGVTVAFGVIVLVLALLD
ncbi:hypothetical protein [Halobacterium bonnevillei]|uniref:DUF6199 domain-containing protein n=1 Tax=Halobacterium bonnevillei TaxID=2692200 RepID=A0A6B0SLY5_9EURY|nr:hypothetical protein [Halobacterium bonnevillei]MXR19962.1 hypothetical protein [Halobacterium bonnevillei]